MRMELIDKVIATLQPLLAKLIDKTEIARIEPLLCSVAEAAVITCRSKRFIADGIARGLFQAKKSDGPDSARGPIFEGLCRGAAGGQRHEKPTQLRTQSRS
jgi:hypothetical protein